MGKNLEVFGVGTVIIAPTVVNNRVPWSGGRGLILLYNSNFTGTSAKVTTGFYSDFPVDSTLTSHLWPLTADITADGVYPFEAPEGDLFFSVALSSTDEAHFDSGLFVVPIDS